MKVNLLKERNKAYSVNWMEIIVVLAVVLLIASIGVHYYTLYDQKAQLTAEVDTLNTQAVTLRIRVAEYNRLKKKVDELTIIKEKLDSLKYVWDRAIIEQGYVIPNQVMLRNLSLEDNSLTLSGRAVNDKRILDLRDNMKLSPIYEEVTLQEIRQGSEDYDFSIDAIIAEEGDQNVE